MIFVTTLLLGALLDRSEAFTTASSRRFSSLTLSATSLETSDSASSSSSDDSFQVDYEAYSKGFGTVFQELAHADLKPVEGDVPRDLVGTYFRNGPAMFSAGSILPPKTSIIQPRDGPPVPDGANPARMVKHPYEADGGILAVTIGGSQEEENDEETDADAPAEEEENDDTPLISARFRYVRTTAFTNERRKGQRLYKAMDSTRELGTDAFGNDIHYPLFKHHLQPGLNKNRKNTSNGRTVFWGNRLMSLWEGGQPYKMDALGLSTEGRSQLGGVLKEQESFGGNMAVDLVRNRAIGYGVTQEAKTSTITTYEFDDKFRLLEDGKASRDLPGMALISDIAATASYSVVVQPAVSAGMQFLFVKEPGKVLKLEQKPAKLHLLPRTGAKVPRRSIEIPFDGVPEADLQFVNAYEDGSTVILDAVRSDGSHKSSSGPSLGDWPWASTEAEYVNNACKTSLWRYTVDLDKNTIAKVKLSSAQVSSAVINPSYSTQPHRFVYMNVGGKGDEVAPPQGVGRYDVTTQQMQTWMPEPFEFCGEPMYAERQGGSDEQGEDSGYVLTVMFDGKAQTSAMLVFDAADLAKGPICRIPLNMAVPHANRGGCFIPALTWPASQIERRAKLFDKMESRGNLWNEVKSDFSGLGLRFDDMEEYFGDSFLS